MVKKAGTIEKLRERLKALKFFIFLLVARERQFVLILQTPRGTAISFEV
jgi:hypothetical protein